MSNTNTTPTKPAPQKITAAEAAIELERIQQLLAENQLQITNRQAELDSLLRREGIEVLESASVLSDEIVRLQTLITVSDRGYKFAHQRGRALMPVVVEEVSRMCSLINRQHVENLTAVRKKVVAQLAEFFAPDAIEVVVSRSKAYRAECAFQFENQPSAGFSFILGDDLKETLRPETQPGSVLSVYHRISEALERTTKHSSELKIQLK